MNPKRCFPTCVPSGGSVQGGFRGPTCGEHCTPTSLLKHTGRVKALRSPTVKALRSPAVRNCVFNLIWCFPNILTIDPPLLMSCANIFYRTPFENCWSKVIRIFIWSNQNNDIIVLGRCRGGKWVGGGVQGERKKSRIFIFHSGNPRNHS